ncbi:hypothetical protein BD779DRAFT_1577803 [Infundibulicybe gibba]|nr:hypothetical protein BD779DRAFT_1577803 [Infundibulicybe gibba]
MIVRIWDAITCVEIALLQGHGNAIMSIAYSPDNEHIVSGSKDRSVRVWNKCSYIPQTPNHPFYSPTLVVRSDSWVYKQVELQDDLLLWIPPFLSILHIAPQLIISKSSQVDIELHDTAHGPEWVNINQV